MAPPPFVRVGGLLKHGNLTKEDLKNEIPQEYIVEHITNDYSNGLNFFIIEAGTGSGKSTTLPLIFYKKYPNQYTISLQPKIATVYEMNRDFTNDNPKKAVVLTLGKALVEDYNLSTQYSSKKTYCKVPGCLVIGSYGSFSMKLRNDPNYINNFKVVILDEVHEDSEEVIELLLFLYYNKEKKSKLPIIILTTATLNLPKFDKYFDIPLCNHYLVDKQTFTKTLNYENKELFDYKSRLIEIIKHLIKIDNEKYDILIFIASNKEIENLKELLNTLEEIKKNKIEIIGFSRTEMEKKSEDYILYNINNENENLETRKRQIIIGTNGLETGVTLNMLRYVINIGFENNLEYIPYLNAQIFYRAPISRSSEIQRNGRVGRRFDGWIYNLYTEETSKLLQSHRNPSLLTNNFTTLMLKRFNKIRFIEEIPIELIYDALYNLYIIGFIDLDKKYNIKNLFNAISYEYNSGYIIDGNLNKLGELGKQMLNVLSKFDEKSNPFNVNNIKFILLCEYFNFDLTEVATIIAMTLSYEGEIKKNTNNDFLELLKEYNKLIKDDKLFENRNVRKKIKINEVVYLKHNILKVLYELGFIIAKTGKISMLNNDFKTKFIIEKIFCNAYCNNIIYNKLYRGFQIKCRTPLECITDKIDTIRVRSGQIGNCEIKIKFLCIKDKSLYNEYQFL